MIYARKIGVSEGAGKRTRTVDIQLGNTRALAQSTRLSGAKRAESGALCMPRYATVFQSNLVVSAAHFGTLLERRPVRRG